MLAVDWGSLRARANLGCGRSFHVDVVDADACSTHDLEVGCFRENIGGDLRGRTNRESVVVPDDLL